MRRNMEENGTARRETTGESCKHNNPYLPWLSKLTALTAFTLTGIRLTHRQERNGSRMFRALHSATCSTSMPWIPPMEMQRQGKGYWCCHAVKLPLRRWNCQSLLELPIVGPAYSVAARLPTNHQVHRPTSRLPVVTVSCI